jgi:hypothetical protein
MVWNSARLRFHIYLDDNAAVLLIHTLKNAGQSLRAIAKQLNTESRVEGCAALLNKRRRGN